MKNQLTTYEKLQEYIRYTEGTGAMPRHLRKLTMEDGDVFLDGKQLKYPEFINLSFVNGHPYLEYYALGRDSSGRIDYIYGNPVTIIISEFVKIPEEEKFLKNIDNLQN